MIAIKEPCSDWHNGAIEHQLPYPECLAPLIHDEVARREQNRFNYGDHLRLLQGDQ